MLTRRDPCVSQTLSVRVVVGKAKNRSLGKCMSRWIGSSDGEGARTFARFSFSLRASSSAASAAALLLDDEDVSKDEPTVLMLRLNMLVRRCSGAGC